MLDDQDLVKQIEQYQQAAWLDLRSQSDNQIAHLVNSANIPVEHLEQRVSELPHKKIPLVLIGSEKQINQAELFLKTRKYQIATRVITDKIVSEDWLELVKTNLAETDLSQHVLWEANLFLQQRIESIESRFSGNLKVLDIGCGSGREAVYLAKRGWQVVAVDNQNEAIQRTNNLAQANNVSIEAIEADIIQGGFSAPDEIFDLIIMFRFLHRPLFERIQKWLKPGGTFLIETFSIEAAKFGKPRRKHLMLKPNEMKQYFTGLTVSEDFHRTLSDGRPLIGCFVNKTDTSGELRVTSKIKS